MRRRLGLLTLVAICCGVASGPAAAAPERRCGAWTCGSIARPLDPAAPGGRQIDVAYRLLSAGDGDYGAPTIVAVEGGPGYPSIGSREDYRAIFGPLLRTHRLLVVDNRGTGASALIDCRGLQRFSGRTDDEAFAARVGACAGSIDGPNLYGTALAADDLAAVLDHLQTGPVTLYGDSYGTYFSQSFAARHPSMLTRLVLDSAYPVRDLNPWYDSSATTMRRAMDAVCARDLACSEAAPRGTPTARLAALLRQLRTAGPHGPLTTRALVDVVQDAGSDPALYRELDASVRAALAGDDVPIRRLIDEDATRDGYGPGAAAYFSDGAYFAVSCVDYPQLFSMASTPAQRRVELAASIAKRAYDRAFAPFTTREWLSMSAYSEPFRACLDWPQVPASTPAAVPPGTPPLPASVPMLVVGGDLDSLTPIADMRTAAAKIASDARVVTVPNTTHVTSEGDPITLPGTACVRTVIRTFVDGALDRGCTHDVPAVRTPGAYPRRFAGLAPATVVGGSRLSVATRRAVTLAASALADVVTRRIVDELDSGSGLRGGRFTASGAHLTLRGVRFVSDAAVSGGATDTALGAANGRVRVTRAGAGPVSVTLRWTARGRYVTAQVGSTRLRGPVR